MGVTVSEDKKQIGAKIVKGGTNLPEAKAMADSEDYIHGTRSADDATGHPHGLLSPTAHQRVRNSCHCELGNAWGLCGVEVSARDTQGKQESRNGVEASRSYLWWLHLQHRVEGQK